MAGPYLPVNSVTFSSDSRTAGSVPASFDAVLSKPVPVYKPGTVSLREPLKLTIKLRIRLQQITPTSIPVQRDADGVGFLILPWNELDWQKFISGATAQANMWNNKFWLKPPRSFTDFDEPAAFAEGGVWRPYIRCELDVDFAPTNNAHRTIQVANLNTNVLVSPDANTFHSHALLFDSLDATPWAFPWGNAADDPRTYPIIAHELGHAMGLAHIGVLVKTDLCQTAIYLQTVGGDKGKFSGGPNSFYCYGHDQKKIHANIMGGGDVFTEQNARPWLWAITSMRRRNDEYWQVLTDTRAGTFWEK